MKKAITILMVATMAASFAACGGNSSNENNTSKDSANSTMSVAESSKPEIKTESYDTGAIKVSVPEGWKAIPVQAYDSEQSGGNDKNQLMVYKTEDVDYYFSDPGITIKYAPNTTYMNMDWDKLYTDVKEIKATKIGEYTWEGIDATNSMGNRFTLIHTTEGDGYISLTVFTEINDKKISFDDEDVQTIIKSLEIKK